MVLVFPPAPTWPHQSYSSDSAWCEQISSPRASNHLVWPQPFTPIYCYNCCACPLSYAPSSVLRPASLNRGVANSGRPANPSARPDLSGLQLLSLAAADNTRQISRCPVSQFSSSESPGKVTLRASRSGSQLNLAGALLCRQVNVIALRFVALLVCLCCPHAVSPCLSFLSFCRCPILSVPFLRRSKVCSLLCS